MTMSRHAQILREQRLAEQLRPLIITRLRAGDELLGIAEAVAESSEIDARTAYKWVSTIAEDFTRRRRRIVIAGLGLLWVGVLAAAAGVLLHVFGVGLGRLPVWQTGLVVGGPVAVTGGLLIRFAPDLVRRSV